MSNVAGARPASQSMSSTNTYQQSKTSIVETKKIQEKRISDQSYVTQKTDLLTLLNNRAGHSTILEDATREVSESDSSSLTDEGLAEEENKEEREELEGSGSVGEEESENSSSLF